MSMTMSVPRPLHHFLVSGITQFVLVIAAILVLVPTGLLFHLPLGTLGAIFLYNVLIATLVAIILTNNSLENKPAVVKGAGLVIGHLVGLVLGALIGAKYGGTAWAIVGGAVLYFLVGWLGTRISIAADSELEKLGAPRWQSPADKLVQSSLRRNKPAWCIYGAAVPALLLVAAVFVKISGLPVGPYTSVLPNARVLIAILSLVSITVPWLRRTRWMQRRQDALSRGSLLVLVGLVLSLAPAFYGFLLFVAFGLSITELILFAATASIATATWSARTAR
jgi:hypothetical protein